MSNAKSRTFNLLCYFPTAKELKAILQKSNSFNIERMEIMKSGTFLNVNGHVACLRAVHQNMLTHKFGAETIDETFNLLKKKFHASLVYANPYTDRTLVFVAILKHRNVTCNQVCMCVFLLGVGVGGVLGVKNLFMCIFLGALFII